jgi:hypothetical protein
MPGSRQRERHAAPHIPEPNDADDRHVPVLRPDTAGQSYGSQADLGISGAVA